MVKRFVLHTSFLTAETKGFRAFFRANRHNTTEITLFQGLERPAGWLATVNGGQPAEDPAAVRQSIARGRPLGSAGWVRRVAALLGLESSLRPRGRPRKEPEK